MTERSKQEVRKLPHAVVACAISLSMLLVSVSAYSDTYNFYFTKPKKKGSAVDNAPAADNDDEEDQSPPSPAAAAAPSAPATTTSSKGNQVVVPASNGQQPIIINNNNNISMPQPAVAQPLPQALPPAPPPSSDSATVATAVLHDEYRYPWHFGLSSAYYNGRPRSYYSSSYTYDEYGYPSYSGNDVTVTAGSQWSGLVNLGVDFTRVVGLNVYASKVVAGDQDGHTFDLGGDFEFTPFRISGLTYDYLRIGLLAGSSAAFAADSSLPLNVGARFTVNLDRQFGITAAVRTNFHMEMAEAGIVTHF